MFWPVIDSVFKYTLVPGRPYPGILPELSDRTIVDLSDIVVIELISKVTFSSKVWPRVNDLRIWVGK